MSQDVSSSTPTTSPLAITPQDGFRLPSPGTKRSADGRPDHPSYDLRWLRVLEAGLGHRTFLLTASENGVEGQLPMALVSSLLFGRFLVSLPYINAAGVTATSPAIVKSLVDQAIALADKHNCRYLELRQEQPVEHARLQGANAEKCLIRMALPVTVDGMWDAMKSKVRSQVRKGQRPGYDVAWGGLDQLDAFYEVFARTMRDLGTPVFGRKLFRSILQEFGGDAELCVVRDGRVPISGALLVHGATVTEVPSAAARHDYRSTNVNMLMYWHLFSRAIERGSTTFDFGRSTREGSTYQFKMQWGAEEFPSTWQYYLRQGSMDALRPSNPKNQRLIHAWKRMPLWLSRLMGPSIVRGIP